MFIRRAAPPELANAEAAQFLWDHDLIAELDLRPPEISTSVLQNPAASKYADIVVVSDRTLQTPPVVNVWVGIDTTSVIMDIIPGAVSVYKGGFEFTESGTYTIQTKAVGAINGVDSTQTRSFAAVLARAGLSTSISALNQQAVLRVSPGSLRQDTYIIADYLNLTDDEIYRFGPDIEFHQPMLLELKYEETAFPEPSKIFVYHKRDGDWQPLQTQVTSANHSVKAHVSKLGEFKLVYDPTFQGTNLVPETFSLKQNYPNPFNPRTTIEYDIPEDSHVIVTIFNAIGQVIRRLLDEQQIVGRYRINWDGTNEHGDSVSSGVYFYQIKAGEFRRTRKMTLLR